MLTDQENDEDTRVPPQEDDEVEQQGARTAAPGS